MATKTEELTAKLAPSAPTQTLAPPVAAMTPRDALRLDEVKRFCRMTYPSNVVAFVIVLALLPFLPGDPFGARLFVGGIFLYAAGATWLRWKVRDPKEWRERNLMILTASGGGVVLGLIYYWGAFSFAPMVVVAAVYVASSDGETPHAALTYAMAAVIQAAMAIAIMTGALEDRGLFVGFSAPLSTQIVSQIVIQGMLLSAFVGGRTTRRITLESIEQADQVAREAAKREAFIAEIRQDMQRAAGVNRQGRFTDQVVGSYRLGMVLGRGGMGEVYEALDVARGTPAAVKLLLVTHLANAQYVERFAREAKAAAALDSPHVVKILEVGTVAEGVPYLAMEKLEGAELAALLQDRRNLPLAEVVELVEQIAQGLEAARKAGIVHRDMKPHNVFSAKGVWKVLDFGVSKLAETDGTLTRGHVVGTPAYMAPEQARGGDVDHRADVYGLAATAYRALTGRAPFAARDVAVIIHDVVNRMPPRPGSLVELPTAVDAVLAVALCKRAEDRFETALDFARELRSASAGELDLEMQRRAAAVLRAHAWDATA